MAQKIIDPVNDGTSITLTGPLLDSLGTPIPNSSVTSALMSMHTRKGTVVGTLNNVNVISDIDANGIFSREFTSAEMSMIDGNQPSRRNEIHIVTIKVVALISGSTETITESVWIEIKNLRHI